MNAFPSASQLRNRRIAGLSVLLFLFMLVLAFLPAWKAVEGLNWGSTIDFHRDQAFVSALLEGHYGKDPIYLGGGMWYTPLISWLEAGVVLLTGLPISRVIVQMGPYANLLAPIAFFIMAWHFFGPQRAVVATAAFLFFSVGDEPGWTVATYSSRLIPVSFTQGLFYFELILLDRAFRKPDISRASLAGAGAGITFLSHAAPAMIAVLIFAAFTVGRVVRSLRHKDRRTAWSWLKASLFGAGAFILTSLPLTLHIIWEQGLEVASPAAFLFTYSILSLAGKGEFLYHNLSPFMAVALVGLWLVCCKRERAGISRPAAAILLAWVAVASLLFLYAYMVGVVYHHFSVLLPPLVPSFHFYFYLKGALAITAGLAAAHLFGRLWPRMLRSIKRQPPPDTLNNAYAFFVLIAVVCTLHYPAYGTRRDIFAPRNRDLAFNDQQSGIEVAERLPGLVPWDAVVLCDTEVATWPMLPTGRHVVSTASTMGNPYLSHVERTKDAHQLLVGMHSARFDTDSLMAKYGVTHLLVRVSDQAELPLASHWFPRTIFRNEGYVLLGR